MTVDEFIEKWKSGDQGFSADRDLMRKDLEEMLGPLTKIRELKKVRDDFKEKYKGQSFSCYSPPWDDIHYAHVAFEKACTEFGESL